MFKTLFSNLFKCKFNKTSGICKEISKRNVYFMYFTEKDKEKIEKFLGEQYDFDFTENGVIVWDEDSVEKFGIIRSFYFPYNSYILNDNEKYSYVSKQDFDINYEITK